MHRREVDVLVEPEPRLRPCSATAETTTRPLRRSLGETDVHIARRKQHRRRRRISIELLAGVEQRLRRDASCSAAAAPGPPAIAAMALAASAPARSNRPTRRTGRPTAPPPAHGSPATPPSRSCARPLACASSVRSGRGTYRPQQQARRRDLRHLLATPARRCGRLRRQ